jgi:hypothetical protein
MKKPIPPNPRVLGPSEKEVKIVTTLVVIGLVSVGVSWIGAMTYILFYK